MPLFNTPQQNIHEAVARELLMHGNDTVDAIVARYLDSWDRLWGREGWDVTDAQAVLDAMGDQAIPAFTANAALGQLIETIVPGAVPAEKLSRPIDYTIDGTRIVLDPEGVYPGPDTPEDPAVSVE